MSNIEIYGRMFNQFKNHELTNIFGEKKRSLILLTVTGDKRYKNKEIEEEYKNLQIIHVLVISGGNIIILLQFIHIFIGRKSKTSMIMSLLFIYLYGKLISFPETLIRALESLFLFSIMDTYGLKKSGVTTLLITIIAFTITFFTLNLGNSFKLSAIYSTVIALVSGFCLGRCRIGVIRFLILNLLLTLTSAIIFEFRSFSVICTSFIANLFISLVYDFAIYLAYIIYFLPLRFIPTNVTTLISYLLDIVFLSINLIKELTYNVCYE